MDGLYQERYENIWHRRPNEGRQEGVDKDGGRDTLVYKTQRENSRILSDMKLTSHVIVCLFAMQEISGNTVHRD